MRVKLDRDQLPPFLEFTQPAAYSLFSLHKKKNLSLLNSCLQKELLYYSQDQTQKTNLIFGHDELREPF